jgi:hypothetical protein
MTEFMDEFMYEMSVAFPKLLVQFEVCLRFVSCRAFPPFSFFPPRCASVTTYPAVLLLVAGRMRVYPIFGGLPSFSPAI